jgi:hypothetical protein
MLHKSRNVRKPSLFVAHLQPASHPRVPTIPFRLLQFGDGDQYAPISGDGFHWAKTRRSSIIEGIGHIHTNLPVVMARRGNGSLKPGPHIVYRETPMANLYLPMANKVRVHTEKPGDSTGKTTHLADLTYSSLLKVADAKSHFEASTLQNL